MGVRVEDTEPQARRMYEDFHAKSSKRRQHYDFGWPKKMQEIGRAEAQMYRSNKWQMDPGVTEDYKHIAEAPQKCFVVPGFLRSFEDNKPLKVYGPEFELEEPMPKHITVLAPLIGVQLRLYNENGTLPRGDNGLYEVQIPHGMLGGANHPTTDEPFLVVYTRNAGVHMIITGKELDVERDGIVG